MLSVSIAPYDASAVNDYGWHLAQESPRRSVRFLRGNKMRTLPALFDEFAAALQFPWYFGENIAALVDCLSDLSWLGDNVLLIVYHSEQVLADTRCDWDLFGSSLVQAAQSFFEPSILHPSGIEKRRFEVVFQCNATQVPLVAENLRVANLQASLSRTSLF